MAKFSKAQEDEALRTCSECGVRLEDNQPRGVWLQNGIMGIICLSCNEKDTTSVKLNSPENPISFENEE